MSVSNVVTLHSFDFSSKQEADLAGWDGSGWYFWDETGAHCHGPFGTKQEAEELLTKYVENML